MAFAVCQVMEKLHEHASKGFAIFIDLHKAYDSVPRTAMWQVLAKIGVPAKPLSIISTFHEDMTASLRIGNHLLDPIAEANGLHQGCTMTPILFYLYMSAVVESWHAVIADDPEIGIHVTQHRVDRLFNAWLAKHHPIRLTELQFADDAAILAETHTGADRQQYQDQIYASLMRCMSCGLSFSKFPAWHC